jgi:hypothetical protein
MNGWSGVWIGICCRGEMENGEWEMENGDWKVEIGDWRFFWYFEVQ